MDSTITLHPQASDLLRLGWHSAVFVTPTESIGQNDETVVFQNAHAIEPAFSVAGTVKNGVIPLVY